LLFACKQTDERPQNLSPEQKMVEVMVDTHIFEAMAGGKKLSGDTLARFIKTNYAEIFRENGITEDQFMRAFDYYEHHPGKMDELMTKVIDELSKMEGSLKGKEEN